MTKLSRSEVNIAVIDKSVVEIPDRQCHVKTSERTLGLFIFWCPTERLIVATMSTNVKECAPTQTINIADC